jgi:hypothetical protein
MQNLHLLEFSAEAFASVVHKYQSLVVPVGLAMISFVFRFIMVGTAEMLVKLACVIVSKSV